MNKTVIFLLVLLILGSALCAQNSVPEPLVSANQSGLLDSLKTALPDSLSQVPAQLDSLFYAADRIKFHYKDEQIFLYGNTSVDYANSTISADSLFIDLKREQAHSYGLTRMQDNGQLLIGTDVSYDVRSQTGMLRKGQSYIENGYYSGDEIRKVGNDTYDIDGGSFTTCDLAEPSYWFWARDMRIYRGDKVVGKHVLAYVNHLPIFYYPFITMSIKRGRHPGFLIPEPGYNSVDGKYIRDLAWYYPYKDFADFTLSLDLMEKTGWRTNFKTMYLDRYLYNGSLSATYQKTINSAGSVYDWALKGNHHHELPERSALDISVDVISNKRVWESSDILEESLAQRLYSSVAYRKPIGNTYLNVGALYNQDLINDTASLSLPSASWSLPTRPLYELWGGSSDAWYSNLSYYYNVRLDHTGDIRQQNPDLQDYIWQNTPDPANPGTYLTEHHLGMKHALGLSYIYKLRGWLNIRQGIDYQEAWFDRDRNDKKWVRGNDYSAYINSSFNLYGIKTYTGRQLKAIRHILTPSVGLTFLPDMKDNADFYGFGSIGLRSGDKQANLNFSLDQKWALKYGTGSNETKLNDFITWRSAIGANLYKDAKPFGSISHNLAFRPGTFKLGNISNGTFKLDGITLGYSSQLNLSQSTYDIHLGDPALRNQYFSHSLTLSGNAPYTTYYTFPKNQTFSSFNPSDSLSIVDSGPTTSTDLWTISVAHDLYSPKNIFEPQNENLRLTAQLKLTKNLSLMYNNYYNLKTHELISQGIRISRDLHCWKLDFTLNKRNEFWDYRIVFFNTQFPDALRFTTRDSKKY